MKFNDLTKEAQARALSDACSVLANDRDRYQYIIDNFIDSNIDVYDAVQDGLIGIDLWQKYDECPRVVVSYTGADKHLTERMAAYVPVINRELENEFLYLMLKAAIYPMDDDIYNIVMNECYNEDGTVAD